MTRQEEAERDALRVVAEAARAMVDPKTALVMCHHERETDFVPGNGCDCCACVAAQALTDALTKVPMGKRIVSDETRAEEAAVVEAAMAWEAAGLACLENKDIAQDDYLAGTEFRARHRVLQTCAALRAKRGGK